MSNFDDLCAVIGECGCRLNRYERAHFLHALICLTTSDAGTTLWSVMEPAYLEGELPNFPNTTPPLSSDNFEQVLSQFSFSEKQCWQIIGEMSRQGLLEEMWERVAPIK